ncbi:MAG: DUF350 domain-containing protein [Gammaproteobacteria bacterium]|nr:DUF350 domain-containing protein [Gammaproteobacteria bacterium]
MIDQYYVGVIGIMCLDLFIAVAAISAFRYFQGVLAGVNTTAELSKKDNFAFGISFAGGALALALIVAAAVGGEPSHSLISEGINVSIYAVMGIILLKLGTLINDKAIFHRFSLKEQIDQQNISAGTVQAANFLALGIIIQSTIRWVETETWEGLGSVVLVFMAAQILLLLITRLRARIYMQRHNGKRLQDALQAGNPALAIRYAGHIIATALGVSAAANLVTYLQDTPWIAATSWFLVSLGIALLITVLSSLARRIILFGIDTVEEVDEQQNVGVAFIEAIIFISIAIILNPLMAMLDTLL